MRQLGLVVPLIALMLGLLPVSRIATAEAAPVAIPVRAGIAGPTLPPQPAPQPAQPEPSLTGTSLESLIAPDGTLLVPNGFSGALDVAGWTLETTPDGRPRFVREDAQPQAALGDTSNWDPRFGNNGADNMVRASIVHNGDIYFGGDFNVIGRIAANKIARYSPATGAWSSLGFGLNGTVRTMAIYSNTLHIGGQFTNQCADVFCSTVQPSNGENNIVSWNGSTFQPLAKGVNASVNTLLSYGGLLYLGGTFVTPCDSLDCFSVPAAFGFNRIGTWNGSSFGNLGNGLGVDANPFGGNVNALAVVSNSVIAGGSFDRTCAVDNCSSWNAASGVNNLVGLTGTLTSTVYSPIYNGLDGEIRALFGQGPSLALGGVFQLSCANADCSSTNPASGLNRIAILNFSGFTPIGFGVNGEVASFAFSTPTLYIGGSFNLLCNDLACTTTAAANGVNGLASSAGIGLSPGGNGVNGSVEAMVIVSSTVYIGGSFDTHCTNVDCSTTEFTAPAANVASLNSGVYSDLANGQPNQGFFTGNGATGVVNAVAAVNGDIYVGGDFRRIGGLRVNHFARYSPATNTWSSPGNGVNSIIYTLAVSGTNLYLGGRFNLLCADITCSTTQVPNGVNYVAGWNGSTYFGLNNGVAGYVNSLLFDGPTLYVGGEFTAICDNGTPNCGSVLPPNGTNRIATWNGSTFSPINFGVNNHVFALARQGAVTYVGGSFSGYCTNGDCTSSITGTNTIIAFNGATPQPMLNGLNGPVRSLAVYSNTLYLGGQFSRLCDDAVCTPASASGLNYLATWNGTSFGTVGNGLNGTVLSLVVNGSTLYIGGGFGAACADLDCITIVTATALSNLAVWNGSTLSPLGGGTSVNANSGRAVNTLAFTSNTPGSDLYVGGDFMATGRGGSARIARWGEYANLAVSVQESAQHVAPGSTISYTIEVTNTGPATAMDAALNLTLPGLATFASVSPNTCTGPIACTIGHLVPGTAYRAVVTMTAGSILGAAVLTGTATSSQVDTVSGNNTDLATVNISGADLKIEYFNVPSTLDQPGSTFATMKVNNDGPLSSNVTATFTVSNLVISNITTSKGSCTGTVCSLGLMANGDFALLSLSLNAPASGTTMITGTLTGSVVDPGNGPPFGYNTSTQTMTVGVATPPADLRIDVLPPSNTSRSGPFTHVFTITNAGPGATLATLTLTYTNQSLVSAIPSQGTCSGDHCSLGTIAAGQTVTVAVTTNGLSVGSASISAVVLAAVTDPTPSNNSVSRNFSVTRAIMAIAGAVVGRNITG